MILCTSITQSYLDKSKPFFESTVKYFHGKRICFCIGFICEIEGWETVNVPLPLKCDWQPTNRKDYYSLQHGEFILHYDFKDDDVVMFCDSDMILQREWDQEYIQAHIKKSNTFYITDCSFPALTLFDVDLNLGPSGSELCGKEFCACFMISTIDSWRFVYNEIMCNISFLSQYTHHAAWQLLINAILNLNFGCIRCPPLFCCASWYTGTPAKNVNGKLMIGNELVYFNHTKFNEQ